MSIDFTKPIQTRDGRKVRILCTDAECTNQDEPQPIVGLVAGEFSGPKAWCANGSYFGDRSLSECDLVNVPQPKRKVKVDVRLVQTSDGIEAYAKCDNAYDVWWPHEDGEDVIASTSIEMEYEERP